MKSPCKIYMNWVKINFKKKVKTVQACLVCSKEFWGRTSLLQHFKNRKEEVKEKRKINVDKCNYKSISRKHFNNHISTTHLGIHFCVLVVTELLRQRGV